ncbi:helix-turn-helix transcriptional regulator [Streptomyces sp. LP11]|uniref:Helix-turn-helix transcriptional regulator n=1 Tax=Streptomyces pyxinicus TaxID=2970331 RepID=A0ABT2AYB9_9ACTN|nr:helix-turn-helix transcriptional regulator [Streptomyces sp. LP11]MCS0601242.1 helix-turn-helix transcriptional regulator [Streptomyces sp. LP11]
MKHHEHGADALCPAGKTLYERALREGRLTAAEAAEAPCLTSLGLLHPAVDDLGRLEPATPAAVLDRFLSASQDRIHETRRREERLLELFEPLLRGTPPPEPADTPTLRLLSGTDAINEAISDAMATAAHELWSIQPHVHYHDERGLTTQDMAMDRDQALLDRGCRIRTLYQHTQRHMPLIDARYEQLRGRAEARTLDELPDRHIIVDAAVAFVPAGDDQRLALEVRHPALVGFFRTAFERLWQLATPMYPRAVQPRSSGGVTPRQRAIATLLVEGHTDAAIAERLGMNVRTTRLHISKLATTLGSESRAQLGYLIARSGILDQEAADR